MANIATASKEQVDWAIMVIDTAGEGGEVSADDFFKADAILTVVSYAAFDLAEENEQLRAEVERLKLYTNPKLFAAASNVLEAMDGKGPEGAKNKMDQQLEPCPFICISRPTVKTAPPLETQDVARAWVECEACGSRGPSVSSDVSEEEARLLAVTLWNRRKDRDGYTIDNEAGDDDPAGWS